MPNRKTNSTKSKKGQGMTEYIIIVCLIAVACLVVVGIFGGNIRNLFSAANDSLSGGAAETATLQEGQEQTTSMRINNFGDDEDPGA